MTELNLFRSIGISLLEEKYEIQEKINGGMGARSFRGIDKSTNTNVFIKYLLFPRSPLELAKFKMETDAHKFLGKFPGDVIPKLIAHGSFYENNILYLVTEWVEGEPLSNWITNKLQNADWNQRLEIVHRVVSAAAYKFSDFAHRDLHPGNIILMNSQPTWKSLQNDFVDPATKIIDWGESYSWMTIHHHTAPDYAEILADRTPKHLAGSFYGLPPEVLSIWDGSFDSIKSYDSWSIGLLMYKILTDKDLLAFNSIGMYNKAIQNRELHKIINDGYNRIRSLNKEGCLILAKLFLSLMELSPKSRETPAYAARVLWDIRIEELIITDEQSLKEYMMNPYDYEPQAGWKYSHYFEN
jgi:serine/threonine protein kinase